MLVASRFLVTMFYFAHTITIFSVGICNWLSSFDNLVKSFGHYSIDDNMHCFANFLYELIMIRERRLYLNDSVGLLLTGDVNDIIHYVGTS